MKDNKVYILIQTYSGDMPEINAYLDSKIALDEFNALVDSIRECKVDLFDVQYSKPGSPMVASVEYKDFSSFIELREVIGQ